MQTVDEKPETIHVYVVREKEPKPLVFPIVLLALSLVVLFTFCALIPYQQLVTRAVIRVPAVLLPVRTFSATVAVIHTGIKTYPATTAHGILTITNGSIIGQYIPAGFTIGGVATDRAVYVPGGSATGYGWAQVSAHALYAGKAGNLSAYSINSVVGSSVYIRNLTAFYGGRPAYSVKFVTALDKVNVLQRVRTLLMAEVSGLHYPCNESFVSAAVVKMTWRCQFVSYSLPLYMHVIGVKIIGKNLLISVWFVARPAQRWAR